MVKERLCKVPKPPARYWESLRGWELSGFFMESFWEIKMLKEINFIAEEFLFRSKIHLFWVKTSETEFEREVFKVILNVKYI